MPEMMNTTDGLSLREHAHQCAKKFKSNWIDLGRALYTIWKDKAYKQWGYATFDAYVGKEIGIRKQTSMKLLRSYCFLEKEESGYLQHNFSDEAGTAIAPDYESVDVLRRAKNNKVLNSVDYVQLRKNVLDNGKDAVAVRKDVTTLIRQREEFSPEEAWTRKKETHIKRLVTTLRSLKRDAETLNILPKPILNDIAKLIDKLDVEMGR